MKTSSILSVLCGILALAASGATQQAPPGGGWTVSYTITGSTASLSWTRDPILGIIPVTSSNSYQDHPWQGPAKPWINVSGSGTTEGGTRRSGYAAVNLTVKTTFTWQGGGSPPSELKVKMDGTAGAESMDKTAEPIANNGLNHQLVSNSYPMGQFTMDTRSRNGSRYRKFMVPQGKTSVSFVTSVSSSAAGVRAQVARAGAGGELANWSLSITSDRDGTYRRVVKPDGSVRRVSNNLEDDEVTLAGGDGNRRGDSVATEAWDHYPKPRDFASTFRLYFNRAYSWSSDWSADIEVIDAEDGGGANADQTDDEVPWRIGKYESIADSPIKPIRKFRMRGWLNDRTNGINDEANYFMRVHLAIEKEDVIASYGSDYLIFARIDDPTNFGTFHSSQISQEVVTGYNNSTTAPLSVNMSSTSQKSYTSGWEAGAHLDIEGPIKAAKATFGTEFKVHSSNTFTLTQSNGGSITVPPMKRLKVWASTAGVLAKHRTSLWNDQGFTGNHGREYVIEGAYQDIKFQFLNLDANDTPSIRKGT